MSEQKLQAKIIKWMEAQGCYVIKVITGNKAGILDINACTPRGRFFAVEVKFGRNQPSKLQVHHANEINKRNGIAIVAWDLETVQKALQQHMDNLDSLDAFAREVLDIVNNHDHRGIYGSTVAFGKVISLAECVKVIDFSIEEDDSQEPLL